MITAIDKNTALVLIDLQNGITKREVAHPIQDIISKSAELVEAFRKEGLPIVPVTVNPSGATWMNTRKEGGAPSPTMTNVPPEFFEVVDDIKTKPEDIFIIKKTWNAFHNTPLHEELQKRNVTGIVLAGVATSIGVEGTARAASELGYNLTFATDAMTDMNKDAHQHTISLIFPRIGELGTTSDIIEKLNARV